MAGTKINFWFALTLLVVTLTVGFFVVGNDLRQKDNVDMSNESENYIGNYSFYLEDAGIIDVVETDVVDVKNQFATTEDNETGIPPENDFMVNTNFNRNKLSKTEALIQFVKNLPTFMVASFGLDLNAFLLYTKVTVFIISFFLILTFLKQFK